jgi:drug/metabolite transporter, DME family
VTTHHRPEGRWLGYLEALAAAALWGSSGIFAVHLFRLGVTPASVALWRPVIGAIFLIVVFGVTRPAALRVGWKGFLVLAGGGGAAVGVFQAAYQWSTDAVGVPTTVALLYLAPAMVIAAAGPLLGEWPTRRRIGLAALTVGGVWLSVFGAEEVAGVFGSGGLGWGVAAGASYAIYTIFGRYATPRFGAVPTVVYSTVGACGFLVLVLPAVSGPVPLPGSPRAWLLLLAFGALTIGLAQFLFFDALGRLEAGRASITTAAEPVVAAILATFLIGQGLRPIGWLGLALVVAGVVGVGATARGEDTRS